MQPCKSRQLKIVSDGTRQGTAVIDAATGEDIANVLSVTISMDSQGVKASITIWNPELDIAVLAQIKEASRLQDD